MRDRQLQKLFFGDVADELADAVRPHTAVRYGVASDTNLDGIFMHDPTTTISPMLSVRNGKKALEFYKAGLGATELFSVESGSGQIVAQLSVAGAAFWVADESPEHLNFSPETLGGGTVRIILVVNDPDAAFARAVAAGAKEVWPVGNEHGWRMGRVV